MQKLAGWSDEKRFVFSIQQKRRVEELKLYEYAFLLKKKASVVGVDRKYFSRKYQQYFSRESFRF